MNTSDLLQMIRNVKIPNPLRSLQQQMPDIRWKILHPGYSDEVVASLALFVAAAAALLLVALTNRSDMTSATLVLCGFACFIGGLFLLTFHRGETLPPDVAARLAPGAGIGLARIAAALGVDGDAVILPVLGGDPVQFNPSGVSGIPDGTVSSTLVVHEGSVGLSIPPPALLLWHHLRLEFGLVTPDGVEAALSAYRETLLVSLELADSVKTAIVGDDLMIEIIGYHLFDGCRILHEESPKICTMFPCAICGLAGLILVDGTGSAWIFDRIALNAETRSVLITLRQHASP